MVTNLKCFQVHGKFLLWMWEGGAKFSANNPLSTKQFPTATVVAHLMNGTCTHITHPLFVWIVQVSVWLFPYCEQWLHRVANVCNWR
jgi:hypothetical protein